MGPMQPMGRGRGAMIMKVMEARRAMPPTSGDEDGEEYGESNGGGFAAMARGHCEKGLEMAREYLGGEEGKGSALRPKVEALATAYEALLSALNEGGGEEEG